jgi:hypothetical protein
MALANVALTDTFDVWRVRTNQIIISLDQTGTATAAAFAMANADNTYATAAFAKANSANYFAFLVNTNTVSAFTHANGAFTQANGAFIQANGAFAQANIAVANVNYVNTAMQASFAKANSANYYAYLVDANVTASFAKANTANLAAGAAFDKANNAGGGYYKGNNGDKGLASNKGDIFRINIANVTQNLYFSAFENAYATGPLYLDPSVSITINTNARVVIL